MNNTDLILFNAIYSCLTQITICLCIHIFVSPFVMKSCIFSR